VVRGAGSAARLLGDLRGRPARPGTRTPFRTNHLLRQADSFTFVARRGGDAARRWHQPEDRLRDLQGRHSEEHTASCTRARTRTRSASEGKGCGCTRRYRRPRSGRMALARRAALRDDGGTESSSRRRSSAEGRAQRRHTRLTISSGCRSAFDLWPPAIIISDRAHGRIGFAER